MLLGRRKWPAGDLWLRACGCGAGQPRERRAPLARHGPPSHLLLAPALLSFDHSVLPPSLPPYFLPQVILHKTIESVLDRGEKLDQVGSG